MAELWRTRPIMWWQVIAVSAAIPKNTFSAATPSRGQVWRLAPSRIEPSGTKAGTDLRAVRCMVVETDHGVGGPWVEALEWILGRPSRRCCGPFVQRCSEPVSFFYPDWYALCRWLLTVAMDWSARGVTAWCVDSALWILDCSYYKQKHLPPLLCTCFYQYQSIYARDAFRLG